MKKVKTEHQERKRDTLRFFHLRKVMPPMDNPSWVKNKWKVSESNRINILSQETSTLSLNSKTTEMFSPMIITKLFKKNNSNHLQAGLEQGLFTKENNL